MWTPLLAIALATTATAGSNGFTAFDLAKSFDAAGHKLLLDSEGSGTLTFGTQSVRLGFGSGGEQPAKVASVFFADRTLPKTRISQGRIAQWQYDCAGQEPGMAHFVHIDGTVSSRWKTSVGPVEQASTVVERIVAGLEAFERFKQTFQCEPVPTDWRATDKDIAYDRPFEVFDLNDLATLTHLWGWDFKKSWGGSGPGWAWVWPVHVGGVDVWMMADGNGGPTGDIRLESRFALKLDGPEKWIEATNRRLRWGTVGGGSHPGKYEFAVVVDFHSGLTPRKLKRAVERFAREAKKLLKESGGTEP